MDSSEELEKCMFAICIPTFKRPAGLSKLLDSLEKLEFTKCHHVPTMYICIADNDPAGSARHVVDEWQDKIDYPIIYDIENQPGIPFVRNKLVSMAKNAEFIVFIDDDEIATPEWLYELLVAQQKFSADVVMGPVDPIYEQTPPRWIIEGKFHASNRFSDGPTQSNLITWNVLIRRSLFCDLSIRFEEKMAFTGGTDVLLGRILKKYGIEFYWADKAMVHEIVPPNRSQVKWLLLRRFRAGTAHVLINRFAQDNNIADSLHFSLRLFVIGMLKTATSLSSGKHAAVKGIGYMTQSIGVLAGLFGFAYQEYKSVHQHELPATKH